MTGMVAETNFPYERKRDLGRWGGDKMYIFCTEVSLAGDSPFPFTLDGRNQTKVHLSGVHTSFIAPPGDERLQETPTGIPSPLGT